MQWGRKFALVMLVVLVFWTAIPALLCLPTMHPTANHSCCRAMVGECRSPVVGASGSCCQVDRQNPTLPQVSQYSIGHSTRLALVVRQADLRPVAASAVRHYGYREAAPPPSSSGNASNLRI